MGKSIPPGTVSKKMLEEFPVLGIAGYFTDSTGPLLDEQMGPLLREGKREFILDLSACQLINSPGVVALLDIVVRIVEDFRGKLCLAGVDELKVSVFEMAGIFPMADLAKTIPEAITRLRSLRTPGKT